MKVLVLKVPVGFNAALYCDIATAMTRDSQNEHDRRDYDYDLGDYVSPQYLKIFDDGEKYELYAVNADWIDMALLDSLKRLQSLCEVDMWFENSGGGTNEPVEWEYDFENRCDLYRRGERQCFKA